MQGEKMSESRHARRDKVDTVNWADSYLDPEFKSGSRFTATDAEFAESVWSILDNMGNLLITKQKDYGPGNINHAYGGPINGLLVRIGDKFERLKNLYGNDIEPNHESTEDSLKDLANYAIIALMVEQGLWPKS